MKAPAWSEQPAPAAAELRQRIMNTAFQAFVEKGYAGASTLLIATRAKVSKRDLYAMFPSKEAMLLACITSRASRMRLPEGLPEPQTREMLSATLEAFAVNFLAETVDPDVIGMYRLAIAEAVRAPVIARMLEDAREANRARVHEMLVQAQGRGLLPPGDAAEMVRRYFALMSEDLTLSLLLRGVPQPSRAQIGKRARTAAAEFLALHPHSQPGA